jgi:hypothetical protein
MAEECGLLDLYRQTYYMASGVSHSEWWSIETHAMERLSRLSHRVGRVLRNDTILRRRCP